MNISFVSQGLDNANKVPIGDVIISNLSRNNFTSFKAIVAFMSRAGIKGLSNAILSAKHRNIDIKFIVGVDNEGTSKEALEVLHQLQLESYIYYTTQKIIFHPKIYLFEGNQNLLIVGSSNLTLPGLYQNVESSIIIEFESDDIQGKEILNSINSYFNELLTGTDANVEKLTQELINDFVAAKIVPSERYRIQKQNKLKKRIHSDIENKLLEKIKSKFPSIEITKPSASFWRGPTEPTLTEEQYENIDIVYEEKELERGILVWQKGNLPASDVQYSKEGTNPTGGIRLTQADFTVNGNTIDQTTYFRNDLFGSYTWQEVNNNPFVEVAEIPININIRGKDFGTYNLSIRHKPSGEAGQANYTTLMSWGEIGNAIGRIDLRGDTLRLYKSKNDTKDIFELVIG